MTYKLFSIPELRFFLKMTKLRMSFRMQLWMFVGFLIVGSYVRGCKEYESAVGDPGMRRDSLRVAIEAWNQCNEVHEEAPHMGSPRQADCFDLVHNSKSYSMFFVISQIPLLQIVFYLLFQYF